MKLSVRAVSRLASVFVAAGCGGVLWLAWWLEPAAQGHGTHQQLGLNGCTVLTLTGWPCPMCGMTTTFSLMADLRIVEATWNQPFGVVLFLLTLATLSIAVAELIWPTDRWRRLWRWLAPWEMWAAALFMVGLGLGWAWKIALMQAWIG